MSFFWGGDVGAECRVQGEAIAMPSTLPGFTSKFYNNKAIANKSGIKRLFQ
jgi:hypothetical protein